MRLSWVDKPLGSGGAVLVKSMQLTPVGLNFTHGETYVENGLQNGKILK